MKYTDGSKIADARLESNIIINRKSVRARYNVFEIQIDKCRIYRIQILDMSKLKFKGTRTDGSFDYEILNQIKNRIMSYYQSIKSQISEEEFNLLPCFVLQYFLSFEIVDGNFDFSNEIIDDYYNCFE
jgi:hypothetical protein